VDIDNHPRILKITKNVFDNPLQDSEQIIIKVNDQTQKIKERKKLKLLKKAVDQSFNAIAITNADLENGPQLEYCNSAFSRMTGYAKEEVMGKAPIEFLQGPETDKNVLRNVWEALEKGEEVSVKNINYRKNGEKYWVEWQIGPVKNEEGEITHYYSVQRDITQYKKNEQLQKLLATIVGHSKDAIYSKNLDGTILTWNKGARDIYGYANDEAIGANIKDLIYDQNSSEFDEIVEYVRSGKPIINKEVVRYTKEGNEKNVSLTITPISDERGEVRRASVVARDITHQVKLRERKEWQSQILKELALGVDQDTL
jgi:PAS domain S-box-containing protein